MKSQLVVDVSIDARTPEAQVPPPRCLGHGLRWFSAQDFGDRGDVLLPRRGLAAQRATPCCCQAVELGPLALLGEAPLALHPAALLHAMQRGVQRAVQDAKAAV